MHASCDDHCHPGSDATYGLAVVSGLSGISGTGSKGANSAERTPIMGSSGTFGVAALLRERRAQKPLPFGVLSSFATSETAQPCDG
eukprot:1388112-Amphidinium_carterae.1